MPRDIPIILVGNRSKTNAIHKKKVEFRFLKGLKGLYWKKKLRGKTIQESGTASMKRSINIFPPRGW